MHSSGETAKLDYNSIMQNTTLLSVTFRKNVVKYMDKMDQEIKLREGFKKVIFITIL